MTTTEIWLLRHGRSTGNRDRIRQGQGDYPLTEEGRRQVSRLAAKWQDAGPRFDAVITSPLVRARETAETLVKSLKGDPPLEVDERWMERHAGEAEGSELSEAPALRRPDLLEAHRAPFEGAESRVDLHLRATAALQDLLRRGPGRFLIVAHGGILNAALHSLLGFAPSGRARLPAFAFDNTGYAVLKYQHEPGRWVFHCVNDTRHLDE